MAKRAKFLIFMLSLALIMPLIILFWGDDLIMLSAEGAIKTADVSKTLEYYQRLETLFPESPRISEAHFYVVGIQLQKKTDSGRRVFYFTDGKDSFSIMGPNYEYDMRQILDMLGKLEKAPLNRGNQWIQKYLPWFKSRIYYELGNVNEAFELLNNVTYEEPETSWPLTTFVRIHIDQGNYREAITLVDNYFNNISDPKRGMTAELLQLKGDASLALANFDDAKSCYTKAKQYAENQFKWLSRQKFIKILRPDLSRENFEKNIDNKLVIVDFAKEPVKIKSNKGIVGNFTINGEPVIGAPIYMAPAGTEILFSGSNPATDVTYTDRNGDFYFPETVKNPLLGIGVPEERANSSSLSLKVESGSQNCAYNMELVPILKGSSVVRDGELTINFDSVNEAVRYDICLIPPQKNPQENIEMVLGSVFFNRKQPNIINWKMSLEDIVSLKPFPLLYDEIMPYHILGPLYPEQKSLIKIKAFDKNDNKICDSLGLFAIDEDHAGKWGIALEKPSQGDEYTEKGLYVHATDEFLKQLKKDPTDKETLIKIIRLYLWAPGVKDIAKSDEFIKKITPSEDPIISRLKAEIDYNSKRFEQAQYILERILEKDTLDAAGYQILAQIYMHKNEYEKSINYFKQAFSLSGKKLQDYSPITVCCLISNFDEADVMAKEMIYDGQRFFDLLNIIRGKNYEPGVMEGFNEMLIPLTQKPDRTMELKFDEKYREFKKTYPEHKELAEIAFKLAFRRFEQ